LGKSNSTALLIPCGQLLGVKITRAGSFAIYGDPAIVNL
jgi:hypothetical protein